MLIYGTRLWFTPATDMHAPLGVVARWLSRKVGKQLDSARFLVGVDRGFEGAQRVTSVATVDGFPQVVAVSYGHPDNEVAGRRWTTEIGLRRAREGSDLECTILLSTSEISARVAAPAKVTRPGLVTELARRCPLSAATQGASHHVLDEDSADGWRADPEVVSEGLTTKHTTGGLKKVESPTTKIVARLSVAPPGLEPGLS
jgi:hypothetical protein